MKNILGRKVGMTSVFTDDGRYVPVTVIEAGPCTVVERRTKDKHGYEAVALAFGDVKKSRVSRALAGHYKKNDAEPKRWIREFRDDIDGVEAGQTITVAEFAPGDRVDVVGISKGHGFAGGIKRHNFSGGGASHGSMIHRQPASNGDTNAGRTVKGSRRPGHFGVDRTHASKFGSRARRRRAQSAARARPGSRTEKRARRRSQEREGGGQCLTSSTSPAKSCAKSRRPTSSPKSTATKQHAIYPRRAPRTREPARRHRVDEKARRSQRRRTQAVEAKRHRPRAPRFDPLAAVDARRRRVRTAAAQLRHGSQQERTPRRLHRRALRIVSATAP